MKIITDKSLKDFEFWSGAVDTRDELTDCQMDEIESVLEASYPDGIEATELNDLFWFEKDTIAEWLGYESFDEIVEGNIEDEPPSMSIWIDDETGDEENPTYDVIVWDEDSNERSEDFSRYNISDKLVAENYIRDIMKLYSHYNWEVRDTVKK